MVELVEAAVAGGADALAAAGGDGTQALVATIAAREGLPSACIPAGTRNHFALDLGVDRDDVVGALDAFVDGGERVVDLAEVNDRVFVNNASLGVYAAAVQRDAYRNAKVSTLLDTVPDAFGKGDEGTSELRWTGPDGRQGDAVAALLVSNNPYRLGTIVGSGTRPRMDGATLGVVAAGTRLRRFTTEEFVVDANGPVPIGIDGEALLMDPPLVFRSRPAALRVRIARAHPGASPSSDAPLSVRGAVPALFRIATGRPGVR
ncbi:MAG: diacylglycerol kinase family protein [Microthrixaceae bacterium]|nr:diacylglycerol kinase family protein [Microthrixaceae bacterium]